MSVDFCLSDWQRIIYGLEVGNLALNLPLPLTSLVVLRLPVPLSIALDLPAYYFTCIFPVSIMFLYLWHTSALLACSFALTIINLFLYTSQHRVRTCSFTPATIFTCSFTLATIFTYTVHLLPFQYLPSFCYTFTFATVFTFRFTLVTILTI